MLKLPINSRKIEMAKEYFADNARFADLCNNILYGGREVILPENLKERDTTEVLTALGLDKKTICLLYTSPSPRDRG